MAAMVNMSSLLNGKDSRWLQLEVCREFQRNKCSRPDTECKFAHPPANVEVQNGRVTACYDSIKGRCNREKPPCKYFHPPQHLKDQLLINGRNHLALKNALMQQMGMAPPTPQPAIIPSPMQQMNRYLGGVPASNPYNPYYAAGLLPQMMGPEHGTAQQLAQCVPQGMTLAQPQKIQRNDRIQVSSFLTIGKKRPAEHQLQMDHMNKMGSYYYENFNFPGMLPYKRPAQDKQPGISIYQPSAAAYQQLMQLQQQPSFVPVSCEYNKLLSVSQLNNSQAAQAAAQAALLSAVLNNQPYHQQQLGMPQSHNLYADPAQMAKEVAQKNYANALKMAVAQQNSQMAGKPLTAMSYPAVTSTASQPTHMTSAYPYAYSQAQAMNAQGMPTSMMQVPQMAVPPSAQTQGNGSAVVLNPYKKMKTS
ncbi:unnamed protein product [Diamesa tonsa]